MRARQSIIPALFSLFLLLQASFAFNAFHRQAQWGNVPPVPGDLGVSVFSLGDRQLAYRNVSLMLQNIGNVGGRVEKLESYDYARLGRWFSLADRLDARSNYVPILAAYYFSMTKKTEDLTPVIDYLAVAGGHPQPDKWRWLAQAVYLARFRQNDQAKALTLSHRLSDMWQDGRPLWMKQMPVFIMTDEGAREAAYDLMIKILKEDADHLRPEDVNFMVDYLCTRILTSEEAAKNPVCASGTGLP